MIAIFGAGGMGREVASLVESLGLMHCFVTTDGDDGILPEQIGDLPCVIALGNPADKERIDKMLKDEYNVQYTVLHLWNSLLSDIQIGEGSIIQRGALITTNVKLGRHVLINLNATVGHDSKIGDYTTVSPGANISGKVNIGKGCYIGTNASIREGITICDDVTIGMGSVVLNDITEAGTYVGVPVKKIK